MKALFYSVAGFCNMFVGIFAMIGDAMNAMAYWHRMTAFHWVAFVMIAFTTALGTVLMFEKSMHHSDKP